MNEGRMIWQKCEVKELRGRTSPTYGGIRGHCEMCEWESISGAFDDGLFFCLMFTFLSGIFKKET